MNIDMELELVFRPATMKGQSIMAGIHEKECIEIWRMDEHSLEKATGVHPPLKMKLNHTVDRILMIER